MRRQSISSNVTDRAKARLYAIATVLACGRWMRNRSQDCRRPTRATTLMPCVLPCAEESPGMLVITKCVKRLGQVKRRTQIPNSPASPPPAQSSRLDRAW
eukprot:4753350-Pleurochrysis_carterae.AAC.2